MKYFCPICNLKSTKRVAQVLEPGRLCRKRLKGNRKTLSNPLATSSHRFKNRRYPFFSICNLQSTKKKAFSILEVILALAILTGAMAVLGELGRLGFRNAKSAQDLTKAQMLCESKMAEYTSGITAPQAVSATPFDAIDQDSANSTCLGLFRRYAADRSGRPGCPVRHRNPKSSSHSTSRILLHNQMDRRPNRCTIRLNRFHVHPTIHYQHFRNGN